MNAVTTIEQPPRLPIMQAGGHVRPIVPQNFEDAFRVANAVCKAGMAPRGLETPEKAMVAIMHGLEVGLTPMNALQSIAVVNGRPTIWGDGAIGLVRGSGLLEWMDETFEGAEGTDSFKAICLAKRRGEPKPVRGEFSIADARKAALFGKAGPWQQYPKRMLQMRARAFALRDGFADVLKGLAIKEEVDDIPTAPKPPPPDEPAALSPPEPKVEPKPAMLRPPPPEDDIAPMPDPAENPVAFIDWLDGMLAQVEPGEDIQEVYAARYADLVEQLPPTFGEDALAVLGKHERRIEP